MRQRISRLLALAGLLESMRQLVLLVSAASSRAWLNRRRRPASGRIVAVVPARDEAHQIEACIRSLLGQKPALAGVVVVDDGSTDGTVEVVRGVSGADGRVHVLAVDRPADWLGKPAACIEGARLAESELSPDWLVFVDADVRLHESALRSLCGSAEERGADATSLIGAFVEGDLGVRLLLPDIGLAIITGEGNPRRVNDPKHPAAIASGQCLAIRSHAYWTVGGHGAVAHEVLEDCRLAEVLQEEGFSHELRLGQSLMQVAMYRDTEDLWAGLTKNMAAMRGSRTRDILRELWRLLAPTWLPIAAVVFDRKGPGGKLGLRALEVVWHTRSGMRIVSGADPELAALAPLSDTVQAAIYLSSVRKWRRGRVTWKGRSIDVTPLHVGPQPAKNADRQTAGA